MRKQVEESTAAGAAVVCLGDQSPVPAEIRDQIVLVAVHPASERENEEL